MFFVAIILLILALTAAILGRKFRKDVDVVQGKINDLQPSGKYDVSYDYDKKKLVEEQNFSRSGGFWSSVIGVILAVTAVVFLFFTMFYTQDVGEAKVLKDWTGKIQGQDTTSGADFKAPWVDTIDFDIRNQLAAFIGNGQDTYNGHRPNGPQITVQDKDGVTANIDIAVIYSVKPGSVIDVYSEYFNQENFVSRLIEQDIRSITRNVPSHYGTLELLNGREKVGLEIEKALEKSWAEKGVTGVQVSLQEIRYSDEVKSNFDAAQTARISVEKATAELEKAKVDAQQKVAQATAEAEANRILAASLTDPILKQRYLDTLGKLASKGNVVVVPEGFNGLVNVK